MVREYVFFFTRQVREEHIPERLVRKLVRERDRKKFPCTVDSILANLPIEHFGLITHLKASNLISIKKVSFVLRSVS